MQNIKQQKNKQLLFRLTKKDFELEFFCAGGNGGQNVNKVATACRIRHPASGAIAKAQEHRTQLANKKTAFERLVRTEEFQKWHKIQCCKAMGNWIDIKDYVERTMKDSNLKLETQVDGKWVEVKPEDIKYEELED